jgi:glycosyltransferase involved in cell wall biosynthesis
VPEKRWDVLIDALAGSAGPSAVVAGHGPLREELERRAGEVAAPVRFLGAIDDVPALLGLARCYVQTSDSEGLPLALLEALSLGLPAVVTAVGGVRDVVPDDAARLVAPGDAGVVRRALSDVLDDPEGAAALGAAARRAAAGWRPERMVGAYRDAYAALLSA